MPTPIRPTPGVRPGDLTIMPPPPQTDLNPQRKALQILKKLVADPSKNLDTDLLKEYRKYTGGAQDFVSAVYDAIDRQDGRWFPWALEGGVQDLPNATTSRLDPRIVINPIPTPQRKGVEALQEFDRILIGAAEKLADTNSQLQATLTQKVGNDGQLDPTERLQLTGLVAGFEAAIASLPAMMKARQALVDQLSENPIFQNPNEIMMDILAKVNDFTNDERHPFGRYVTIGQREADLFLDKMHAMDLGIEKSALVLRAFYDESALPWGKVVLEQGAADTMQTYMNNKLQLKDWPGTKKKINFSLAVGIDKEPHYPIVPMYGIAIRDAIERGDLAEMENVLATANRTLAEFGAEFLQNGAQPLGTVALSSADVSFSAANSALEDRAEKLREVQLATLELAQAVAAMRADLDSEE